MPWYCGSCNISGDSDEQWRAHLEVCPEYAVLRHEHLFPGCHSIVNYEGCHKRAHGWIFGKGESLDEFDMSRIDGPSFCVNESVLLVPHPTYFFALDERPVEVITSRGDFPPSCMAVLTENRVQYAIDHGIPRNQIIVAQRVEDHKRCLKGVRAPGVIHAHEGTAATAFDMAYFTGCRTVTCVGFDGTGGYATSLKLDYAPSNYTCYEVTHEHIREMAKKYGLECEFDVGAR